MKMSDKTDHCFISADIKKENSKSQLLKDDQVHADQDFYDNLPFNKLRNPPKHVRNTISLTNYRVIHLIVNQEQGCCELVFALLRSPKAFM